MILSGNEIRKQLELGRIEIDPFEPKHVNPVSVDLTLGKGVAVYTNAVEIPPIGRNGEDGRYFRPTDHVLDVKREPVVSRFVIPDSGWVLRPGIGYLAHTAERVKTDFYVPILDGKSSIGRLFIKVHETAGFGDPGFNGQYTLEISTIHTMRVYAGMRICQMRFHTIEGEVTPYEGNYTGENAQGPVASKCFRQFK